MKGRSYVAAGVLLPGADVRRLEEVHEELFTRFWGVSIGSLTGVALSEATHFVSQCSALCMPYMD